MTACDACLRRTWLIAALSPYLDVAARHRTRVREVLALDDVDLATALARGDATRLLGERDRVDPVELRERNQAARLRALCRHDERYPEVLDSLRDGPAVLHVAGDADLLARDAVAIVGARRPSPYGLVVAAALARDLARAGLVVVSGMALGVDSAVHEGALDGAGATVAVLAGGADVPYPARKRALHRRIVDGGAVISELPPGTRARRWGFPARNRIIAGLAGLTVVVEGAARSGSLITAAIAADLGRDLGAVPGHVTSPLAEGPNALLADGALVVRSAEDVLDALGHLGRPDPRARLSPEGAALLADIAAGRDTVDALATGERGVAAAIAGVSELELLGVVRRTPGGRFVAVP